MNYRILSMLMIVGVLVVVLMISVTAIAGGNAATESTQAMSAEHSVEGTLTAMEQYGHILIKPDVGNLARLKIRPDTVITRNGKQAKMGDLRVGDKVQANYDSKNWVSELHANGS